jgi:Baseplate J-like protein
MPLQAPNLDDRRFADIVAEAKALIPRYAPAWTNHSDTDPGITLIHLFAWMTDMMLFRLNQVPERSYVKFLELLGIQLQPARPARAELTFRLAREDVVTVMVPRGSQVAIAGADSPLVFETDETLVAIGAKLAAVQVFDGFSHSLETTKNDSAGQWFFPFGPNAREGAALLLGFDSPVTFTDEQVNLTIYVATEGLSPEGHHCDLDLAGQPVPATIVWEYWDKSFWQPISLDKDDTRAFTRSGHVYFTGPGAGVRKDKIGLVDAKLYWIRARLETSGFDAVPRVESILTNTVAATQAVTVKDEVVGGSDGRPGQAFRLQNTPVVVLDRAETVVNDDGTRVTVTSVRLEVDEGAGLRVWQERDDFYSSGPDDPHFLLDRTTGEVTFGDGRHGRIPVANPANPDANIVARLYRYGGGTTGDAGAHTLTELQTFVNGVQSVDNRRRAAGGVDEETLAEAKRRAPALLKSRDRAVTAEDFEFLARETPGVRVRRARALPLFDPRFPDVPIPGVVTVIVVPDGEAPNPLPGEATLRLVCAHLNVHRLITSEVFVIPPAYRKVRIEADVIAKADADLAEVRGDVDGNLTRLFHPLRGGLDGTGWEFGGTIFYSEICRVILQTPGVRRIKDNNLIVWIDDERQQLCRDVPLRPRDLLFSEGHDVRVVYDR